MFLKIHRAPGTGEVVAVCDRELLNTTLAEGDLEVCISEKFYGSTPATEEEVRDALHHAENANLIGARTIAIAVDMGLVACDACIMIGDVPHAQIFRI
ncbi:MAG: DUF424 domain-containing protein [Methanomicrobiaceae archaeon]|nr:DUF424 domain-containing protein [Methanomicrobiaceae archaeon]